MSSPDPAPPPPAPLDEALDGANATGGRPCAPRLADQLCFQLYTASRLVVRAYGPVLKRLGLTYAQYLVMLVLWERDDRGDTPAAVGELGRALALDSGTLTPLLKRLEARGLVRRTRDEVDERVVRATLTQAGRALAAPAAEVPVELLQAWPGDTETLSTLRTHVAGFVSALRGELI